MNSQYMKACISNRMVEITQHSIHPPTIKHSQGGRKPSSNQCNDNYEYNQRISINRARKNIRRLLECNFTDQYAFVTLTFKSTEEVDITDIKSCYKLFTDFKKRLAYYLKTNNLPGFKYLGVTEFQDKNRQGAIHYHLICNLTEVSFEDLQKLWGYGWVSKEITTSNATENKKITFYLNKGITDPRLNGHKRYFHSHGLKQPISLEIDNPLEFYDLLTKCQPTLEDGDTYHSPFTGESKYEQYYVENAKELLDYVQEII
ncbi:rolling circle replication-associated protein [Metabacillus sp. Hm71]|uniref:rolling circle replication-associated protein n=1 Tax=Metabacillus sp. Hm71 TaxID=3450743 RepID=UPI003F432541